MPFSLTHLVFALGLVVGLTTGWGVQTSRIDALKSQHAATLAQSKAAAAQTENYLLKAVQDAQTQAVFRAKVVRRDARASADALERLRDELGRVRAAAIAATPPACPQPRPALGELLAECAAELRDVAEKADRHVSDVRTLVDAWPAASD